MYKIVSSCFRYKKVRKPSKVSMRIAKLRVAYRIIFVVVREFLI